MKKNLLFTFSMHAWAQAPTVDGGAGFQFSNHSVDFSFQSGVKIVFSNDCGINHRAPWT